MTYYTGINGGLLQVGSDTRYVRVGDTTDVYRFIDIPIEYLKDWYTSDIKLDSSICKNIVRLPQSSKMLKIQLYETNYNNEDVLLTSNDISQMSNSRLNMRVKQKGGKTIRLIKYERYSVEEFLEIVKVLKNTVYSNFTKFGFVDVPLFSIKSSNRLIRISGVVPSVLERDLQHYKNEMLYQFSDFLRPRYWVDDIHLIRSNKTTGLVITLK